jgi:hypothetical protein
MSNMLYQLKWKKARIIIGTISIFATILLLLGNSEEQFQNPELTINTEQSVVTNVVNELNHDTIPPASTETTTQETTETVDKWAEWKSSWDQDEASTWIDASSSNNSNVIENNTWVIMRDPQSSWEISDNNEIKNNSWSDSTVNSEDVHNKGIDWNSDISWKNNSWSSEIMHNTVDDEVIIVWENKESSWVNEGLSWETYENIESKIVYSAAELIPLVEQWLLIPSFDPDTRLANSVLFWIQILFRSHSESIQVSIPKETIISTERWVPFNTQALELTNTTDSDYHSSIRIEKYDEFTDSYQIQDIIPTEHTDREEFHFGIPWQHLIFSKPLEVTIDSTQWEGILVDLSADHGEGRSKEGISIDADTECSGWIASKPGTITKVQNNQVKFYICGASTFSLTYIGWANFANFADASIAPWYIDKTVTFITGTHFATGSIISDVDIRIRRRPIDTQNPWSFGTTNCYPNEKYFTLTHPDGTVVNLINAGQLSTPNPSCPETTTNFDQSWATTITNNYSSWTYRPVGNLSTYNNKLPFGVRRLRMWDNAAADGVILYEYTITIRVINPPLCIYSPVSILTWIVVKNTSQVIDQQLDYFQVDDQRWLNSWYYTTLQLSNLSQVGWSGVINNSNIQWKADPLVLLWWTANTLVQLGAARGSYVNANTTSTFIFRNNAPNSFRTSRYGSRLRLRVNVPAYANVGTYDGVITYTLYEN